MLFNTVDYAIFFAVVYVVSWAIARTWKGWLRLGFLLVVSYAFYASWDWRYLPLIFGSSTVDFFLATWIHRLPTRAAKRRALVLTVVLNLGLLAVFKYGSFLLDNARWVQAAITGEPVAAAEALQLLPPVGISFFTFASMAYVFDVYREKIEPREDYLRYLVFVAFFPHLVAGPIVRAQDMIPQLEGPPTLTPEESGEGLFLIALGLLKKVVIADPLALNLVDRVFADPTNHSALEVLAGVYGYAVQIYCDFSGYTDIAIGSALLLGVRFPANFRSPYRARNIADFWRRWHISLSTWLRDYLYIPLGGSRRGPAKTYRNLMITMVLGGLWHGPSWTFVFWGFLHGLALGVTRAFQRWRGDTPSSRLTDTLSAVATFHWVCLAWVFFRAPDFGQAVEVLAQLTTLTTSHRSLPPLVLGLLGLGLASHYIPDDALARLRRAFTASPAVAQGVALFLVAVLLHEASSTQQVPFIYFQF